MTLALAQSFIDAKDKTKDKDAHIRQVQLNSVRYYLDWIFKGRFSSASHAWDTGMSTRRSLTLWKGGMWRDDSEWRDDAAAHFDETQKKVVGHLDKENASSNIDGETTISVSWRGGGDIKDATVTDWTLDTLKRVAMEFPEHVMACPMRT